MGEQEIYTDPQTLETGEESSNGHQAGSWESVAEAQAGLEPCKRHRWAGGNVCIRCGAAKPVDAVSTPSRTRGASTKAGDLEMLISWAWLGLGIGIKRQPWVGQDVVDPEKYPNAMPPAQAVGSMVQLEAGIAGKRIDKALRRATWYPLVAAFVNQVGPAADILPLLVPPLLVGLAAARPDMAEEFKPMMVRLMLPVLAEAQKYAEVQMELMSKVSEVDEATVQMTTNFVDQMLGRSGSNNT